MDVVCAKGVFKTEDVEMKLTLIRFMLTSYNPTIKTRLSLNVAPGCYRACVSSMDRADDRETCARAGAGLCVRVRE